MLKLKAGLPGKSKIVSSLRISDAIMSGREMAEESFVTLRTNSRRPRQLLVVFKSFSGGLISGKTAQNTLSSSITVSKRGPTLNL